MMEPCFGKVIEFVHQFINSIPVSKLKWNKDMLLDIEGILREEAFRQGEEESHLCGSHLSTPFMTTMLKIGRESEPAKFKTFPAYNVS